MFGSVTKQTFVARRFRRSRPTSCVTPRPYRMLEDAISNA